MFGWLLRKLNPTRGWVALEVGGAIPARVGQKFDVRLRAGDELYALIMGRPCEVTGQSGTIYVYDARKSCWNVGGSRNDVIAYRLHDPDSDAEKREARMALFNGIRRAAEKTGKVTVPDHRPQPAPVPVDAGLLSD